MSGETMNPSNTTSFTGITLALSKGRIFGETLPLLARAGIVPLVDPDTSRQLILPTSRPDVRLVIVRASDVPTYVQRGAADLGVAGRDVLLEQGGGRIVPTGGSVYCPVSSDGGRVSGVRL